MFGAKQGYLKGIRSASNFVNANTIANGGASISSTQYKLGATSGNFPGATKNSAIYTPTSTRFAMGTNPFTIECWFYQTSNSNSFPTLISNDWNTRSNFLAGDWNLQPTRSNVLKVYWVMGQFSSAGPMLTGATTISNNTWNHCAIVRTASQGCVLGTSSIDSNGVLTVGSVTSGAVSVGLYLTGTGVPAGTYITANISGTGAGSTWQTNTTTVVSSTTITGNNFNLYVNGVNDARTNSAASLEGAATSRRICVGNYGTSDGVVGFIGYIDEARFSNVARYFTNFTPQTTPFLDDPNTLFLLHMDGANATQTFTDDNT